MSAFDRYSCSRLSNYSCLKIKTFTDVGSFGYSEQLGWILEILLAAAEALKALINRAPKAREASDWGSRQGRRKEEANGGSCSKPGASNSRKGPHDQRIYSL